MTFGSRIRQLRKVQDLTLRELGERVNMDFTYLSKIENGKGDPPSEDAIRRLAIVLQTDAEELILLADKLPTDFERDLLDRPEEQIAGLYRSMSGKRYSNEEWQEILSLLKNRGSSS